MGTFGEIRLVSTIFFIPTVYIRGGIDGRVDKRTEETVIFKATVHFGPSLTCDILYMRFASV